MHESHRGEARCGPKVWTSPEVEGRAAESPVVGGHNAPHVDTLCQGEKKQTGQSAQPARGATSKKAPTPPSLTVKLTRRVKQVVINCRVPGGASTQGEASRQQGGWEAAGIQQGAVSVVINTLQGGGQEERRMIKVWANLWCCYQSLSGLLGRLGLLCLALTMIAPAQRPQLQDHE